MKFTLFLIAAAFLVVAVKSDCYMQNPRGSNNRLNDKNENAQNQNRLFDSQNNANGGYHGGPAMYFYKSSTLNFQWTNQHALGVNGWNHNNIVIQIMCNAAMRDGDLGGGANSRQTFDPANGDNGGGNDVRGMHENSQYYLDCLARERNKGLFIADQNLNDGIGATSTRQNAGGTRYAAECPEERDYYPYWHPTPWIDMVYLTSNVSHCEFVQTESQNVMDKGLCSVAAGNNPTTCAAAGGTWSQTGSHNTVAPVCGETPWSRVNHNGNGNILQDTTAQLMHNLTFVALPDALLDTNCAMRIRYNISTADYDAYAIDYNSNGGNSPVTNDPQIDVGFGTSLQLALNTAQTGRTFEDRTHVMQVKATPPELASAKILNINVMGRRGNIVEVYPAVEYDFVPSRAEIGPGDYVHFQWTGSDYNDQNAAGEGTAGTDRSNIIQIKGNCQACNYPMLISEVTMIPPGPDHDAKVLQLALLGQNDATLNNADPYFDFGTQIYDTQGSYHYMCSRNNNFTNRSQKATIHVTVPGLFGGGAGIAVAVGAALVAVAATAGGLAFYARAHPTSSIGQAFAKRSLAGSGGSVGSRSGNFSQATGMTRSRGSRDRDNSHGSRSGSRGSRKSSKSGKSKKSNASKGSKGTAFTGATAFTRAQR